MDLKYYLYILNMCLYDKHCIVKAFARKTDLVLSGYVNQIQRTGKCKYG